jgi:hypothetical protein
MKCLWGQVIVLSKMERPSSSAIKMQTRSIRCIAVKSNLQIRLIVLKFFTVMLIDNEHQTKMQSEVLYKIRHSMLNLVGVI